MTCDGQGHEDCFCAGDHCACGADRLATCPGCAECQPEPRPPLVFRIVADTTAKHEGLWQMEARRGREHWHLVSDAMTDADVDKQIAHALCDGYKIDDQRSRTQRRLFTK